MLFASYRTTWREPFQFVSRFATFNQLAAVLPNLGDFTDKQTDLKRGFILERLDVTIINPMIVKIMCLCYSVIEFKNMYHCF